MSSVHNDGRQYSTRIAAQNTSQPHSNDSAPPVPSVYDPFASNDLSNTINQSGEANPNPSNENESNQPSVETASVSQQGHQSHTYLLSSDNEPFIQFDTTETMSNDNDLSFGSGSVAIVHDFLDDTPVNQHTKTTSNQPSASETSEQSRMTHHSQRMQVIEQTLQSLSTNVQSMQSAQSNQIQDMIERAIEAALLRLNSQNPPSSPPTTSFLSNPTPRNHPPTVTFAPSILLLASTSATSSNHQSSAPSLSPNHQPSTTSPSQAPVSNQPPVQNQSFVSNTTPSVHIPNQQQALPPNQPSPQVQSVTTTAAQPSNQQASSNSMPNTTPPTSSTLLPTSLPTQQSSASNQSGRNTPAVLNPSVPCAPPVTAPVHCQCNNQLEHQHRLLHPTSQLLEQYQYFFHQFKQMHPIVPFQVSHLHHQCRQ